MMMTRQMVEQTARHWPDLVTAWINKLINRLIEINVASQPNHHQWMVADVVARQIRARRGGKVNMCGWVDLKCGQFNLTLTCSMSLFDIAYVTCLDVRCRFLTYHNVTCLDVRCRFLTKDNVTCLDVRCRFLTYDNVTCLDVRCRFLTYHM